MSKKIITGEDFESKQEAKKEDVLANQYQASEQDEECFFLMYHMQLQPSEAYGLETDHRKWIIGRMLVQKQMEREMMQQQEIARRIGPNLKI